MGYTKRDNGWSYSAGQTPEELAIHEAGHVVMLIHNGYRVKSCIISSETGNGAAEPSGTGPEFQGDYTHSTALAFHVRLASSFAAGIVAEFIEAGGEFPGLSFSGIQHSDYFNACAVFNDFQMREREINAFEETTFSTSRESFLQQACEYAYKVLTAEWDNVTNVANALIEKLELNQADILQLVTLSSSIDIQPDGESNPVVQEGPDALPDA